MLWYAATGHHPYRHLHKQDSVQYGPNTTTRHRGTSETLYLKDKLEDMSDHGKIGQGKRYGSPKFSDIQLEAEPIKPIPFNISSPTLNLEITDAFERQSSAIDEDEDEAAEEEGDDEPNSERDVSNDVAQSSYPIDRDQWDDIHRARRSIELFQVKQSVCSTRADFRRRLTCQTGHAGNLTLPLSARTRVSANTILADSILTTMKHGDIS